MAALLAKVYGFGPAAMAGMTLLQVDAYLQELPEMLKMDAGAAGMGAFR